MSAAPRWLARVALCALVVTGSRAHASGEGPAAARLIEEWRYEEARALVDKLLGAAPGDEGALYLDAVLRFHEGDYPGAADRLGGLLGRPSAAAHGEWSELRDLVDSTRAATAGFVEARSPGGHFVVRYAPGPDEVLLPYALEALEAARREIGERDFAAGALLASPIRVEIFPEAADLAKVSTLTLREIETSGTIAVCKFNKLMVTSPRGLVGGYPWLDTLAHELTHFVVSRVSHNAVPIWLQEGLAKYEERRWRPPGPGASAASGQTAGLTPTMEHLLATALGHGRRLVAFAEMSPSMAKLPSQEETSLAFAEVYTVVEYVLSRRGWDGLRAVVLRMRDGDSDAAAVAAVLGQPFDEFERAWRAWLRGRKLRARPGLVPGALRFQRADDKAARKPPGKVVDKDADAAEDVQEERARRCVRLAGMLRAKGRLAAAALEYERAAEILGPGHPVVGPRLGRTRLALGEVDGAIAAAGPAWDLYEDVSPGAAVVLGEAWKQKGDAARAAGFFEAALRDNPFDPAPHCALAALYPQLGDGRAGLGERENKACAALSVK